jgi:hypothetical protein
MKTEGALNGHWPTRQFINMVRLIPVLDPPLFSLDSAFNIFVPERLYPEERLGLNLPNIPGLLNPGH